MPLLEKVGDVHGISALVVVTKLKQQHKLDAIVYFVQHLTAMDVLLQ